MASFAGHGLSLNLVGTNKILRATQGSLTADTSTFTITHAAAASISLTTQPGGGAATAAWAQQPVAEIRDASGNRVTTGVDATANVTVTLTTGTGSLAGTAVVAASGGVATFAGLSIDLVGTDKVLTFSKANTTGGGGTAATTVASSAFTISSGAASQLAFGTQPGGGTAGAAWAQQPVVRVLDASNNLITAGVDSTRVITLTLTTGTGTLAGTATATAVAGVATYAGLSLNLVGTDKVLTASTTITAGAVTRASSAFTITHAAASQLVFSTQPGGGVNGATWPQQPVVQIQDASGNVVTGGADATRSIALTLTTGPGTLSGTATLAAVAGVATFSGLNIQLQGTGDKLTASTTIIAGAVSVQSAAFNITLGAALSGATWPFDALSDALYTKSSASSTDLTAGRFRLKPSDQTDDTGTAFNNGTMTGATQHDGTVLRLGTTGSDLELNSSWTPAWSNLVGYWKFNESAGATTVTDSSPAAPNTGTVAGATLGATGKLGNGVSSTATGLNVDYGNKYGFAGTASFSVAFWAKGTCASGFSNLINKRGTDGNGGQGWVVYANCGGGGYITLRRTLNNTEQGPGSASLTDGLWHHLAFTYDGATIKGYTDGRLYATAADTRSMVTTTQTFWVEPRLFTMDDVAVWNTPLTAEAVTAIYEHQSGRYSGTLVSRAMDAFSTGQAWQTLSLRPSMPFLKGLPDAGASETQSGSAYSGLANSTLMGNNEALWHLDQAAGTTGSNSVLDTSGVATKHHATPVGTVEFGTAGKIGSGASFSGASQYLTVSPSVSLTGDFTLSAWVFLWRATVTTGGDAVFGIAATGNDANFASGRYRLWDGGQDRVVATTPATRYTWEHYVITRVGTSLTLYRNGVSDGTGTWAGTFTVSAIGSGNPGTTNTFNGSIDEAAIWTRGLSSAETYQLYRRGANRIRYQVRSCGTGYTSTPCDDNPAWKGPDGSSQTYFSELYNTASNSLTGAVQTGLPLMNFTNFGSLGLANNRYFQYRAILESDAATNACDYGSGANTAPCSPELATATAGPTHYNKDAPHVSNATGVPFHYLTGITETVQGVECPGGIRYLLSPDNTNWYYWDAGDIVWTTLSEPSTGILGYSAAAPATTLTPSILNAFATQAGTGNLYYRAFLGSDGTQACSIDSLSISGNQ